MTGYLVDGATELVGAALVLALLDRTDGPVYATAAPHTGDVADTVRSAARAYGYDGESGEGFLDRHADRLHVRENAESALSQAGGAITDMWYCPQYAPVEDRPAGGDHAVDVEAARRRVAAAEAAGVVRFELIGTAYVSGAAAGRVGEQDRLERDCAVNDFERSQLDVEQLVRASPVLATRIWRPGIVVGHSRTFAAVGTSPFYGVLDALARAQHGVEALVGSLMSMRAMAIALDPGLRLNLVPVDLVVEAAVTASLDTDFEATCVHLTNAETVPLGAVLAAAFEALHMAAPDYVASTGACLGLEELCDAEIRSYGSCFTVPKEFVRDPGVRSGPDIALTAELLTALCRARAGLVEAGC